MPVFEDLVGTIRSRLASMTELPDPPKIDDPVARLTHWTPLVSGGSNFCTHRFAHTGDRRAEFRPTLWASLLAFVFGALGLFLVAAVVWGFAAGGADGRSWRLLIMALFAIGFLVIGGLLFRHFHRPLLFDHDADLFWRSRKPIADAPDVERIVRGTPFADIHAIQIIREYCNSNRSAYFSYELNLVLNDGRRVNVIDHGHLDKLYADAKALSEFLGGVPIWDGT